MLQCGPSLDTLGPDEIKGFANIRSLGNRLFPEEARPALLSLLIIFCLSPLIAVNVPGLEGAANIVKPIVVRLQYPRSPSRAQREALAGSCRSRVCTLRSRA